MKGDHTITRMLLLLVAAAGLAVGGGWQATSAQAGTAVQQRDSSVPDAAWAHRASKFATALNARSSAPGQEATLTIRTAPPLRHYVLDEQGGVRKHVALFVNGEMLLRDRALERPLAPGDQVMVIQALTGG